ncbi:MAG TPA: carbohydrate ABC transporter permease [Amnibacterium sp.]|uniref:carbohydrate ABC transporter permease n=1 Tax=Amnibacterium sp. TaxID=1872496 RepID=UPI002F92B317
MTSVVDERMRSDRIRRRAVRRAVASWTRFVLMVVVTVVLLGPVLPMFWRALVPGRGSVLDALAGAFADGPTLQWLGNSALVSVAAVVVTVLVAAPAGYVLSRVRGRSVGGFAIVLFALQAMPVLIFIVPLFILFAQVGLTDSLSGITIIYVGIAVAVATWTMASAIDALPVQLEEAAWLDGCSVLGGFLRVVLPNALPGVLGSAVFTFLLVWNDYLIADVFLHTDTEFTIGIGLAAVRAPILSLVALIPPLVVFAVLHRWFTFGGVGGSLAGR